MRALLLGLLLGALVAFPALAVLVAHIAAIAVVWGAGQPWIWALIGGLLARPHLDRRLNRRTP